MAKILHRSGRSRDNRFDSLPIFSISAPDARFSVQLLRRRSSPSGTHRLESGDHWVWTFSRARCGMGGRLQGKLLRRTENHRGHGSLAAINSTEQPRARTCKKRLPTPFLCGANRMTRDTPACSRASRCDTRGAPAKRSSIPFSEKSGPCSSLPPSAPEVGRTARHWLSSSSKDKRTHLC